MIEIPLTKGLSTIVDSDVSIQLLNRKYCSSLCGGKYYAVTYIDKKQVYLHRLLTNAPVGKVVDHINGDTLDNRLENLRVCSHKENIRNQRSHPDKLQKYRGVDFMKSKNKYRARITCDGKEIHIGLFDTAENAFTEYKKMSKELFKNFSNV